MFLTILLISVIFISLALVGLGIKIIFTRQGRFPETHVGRNKEMAKRGIKCAQSIDVGCHSTEDFPGCPTCKGL